MSDDSPTSSKPKRKFYRPPHRMRNHEEAHRDAKAAPVLPVRDHPLVPGNDPAVVDTQAGLDALIQSLRDAGRFGYDTEFIGEQSFHAKFCVIQVSTPGTQDTLGDAGEPATVTLIDALAEGLDLSGFWALLADGSVEKLVHAGRQDLEPAVRFAGSPPRNVFDMQIAAAFAGGDAEALSKYPASLGALVERFAEADTGHGLKFSQWDRRPLSLVQKQYAANDVRYLPLLRAVICAKVEELGNTEAMQAELATQEAEALYRFDPLSQKVRAKGVGALGRRKQAVLQQLLLWRAATAEAEDMPPRMLVKDDVLVAVVHAEPGDAAALGQVKGLPRPVREDFSGQILDAVAAGQAAELPPKRPRLPRLSDGQKARIDAIWDAGQAACVARRIAPGLAFTKRAVTEFVRATTGTDELPRTPMLEGWREAVFRGVLEASLPG